MKVKCEVFVNPVTVLVVTMTMMMQFLRSRLMQRRTRSEL